MNLSKLLSLAVLLLALSATNVFALSVEWDPVTVDVDGNPLSAGNEVTAYRVYRCQSNSCTLGNGIFVSSVPAPSTSLNIDNQPKPSTYFVTAQNISGEGSESVNSVRVTPPGKVTGVGVAVP